jgi:hypothetical protein
MKMDSIKPQPLSKPKLTNLQHIPLKRRRKELLKQGLRRSQVEKVLASNPPR